MPQKSVLITGAAGFIGSHLAERCLSLGWHVIAIDAFTDYYSPLQKRCNIQSAVADPGYTLIEGDLLSLDLTDVLDEVSIVFHLAAQPGVRTSWDNFRSYTRQNVDATHRLLHAARGRQLHRFVLASSSSIYGDSETLPVHEDAPPRPVSPYGVTKLGSEHLARVYWQAFGVPTVSLRYFTVYGPRQRPDMAFRRLIATHLAGDAFEVFGDGRQTRDFTFVSDTITATLAAGRTGHPGSVYNIGGGTRSSLNLVLDALAQITGTPVRCRNRDSQIGDARHTAADITRAHTELGFTPVFDLETGLREQVEWQSANGHVPGDQVARDVRSYA